MSGRYGQPVRAEVKSNTDIRSPVTARRQGLMVGSGTPNTREQNRRTEVWSKTSEQTYPPRVQGETTIMGTRKPSPMGFPELISPAVETVDSPSASEVGGTGGGTWSKKPPFSS